ncbi:MAG: tRNA (guanine(10)-N(2))-dimethyltransferase [Candidatus Aenigmatarchaeota archaeon]
MSVEKVREGKVEVWASPALGKGAFYNPAAEFQRDISISVLQTWQRISRQKLTVCDALAAAGMRGLRYAAEVEGLKEVVLNDKNPFAVKVIKKNITLNKLQKRCRTSCVDANRLFHDRLFDFIDIDPFGSPNLFLDGAARSVWHKGFVAVTATDTAPLSGSAPAACFRKYGIVTFKGAPFYSELGLRTLVSFIILTFARRDRAFVPVLSHSTRHYFRCYGRIGHAGEIEGLLKKFKFVSYNPKTGEYRTGSQPIENWQFAGPIYLGPIQDKVFVNEVLDDIKGRDFKQKPAEAKMLSQIMEEADAPPFYWDLHVLASKLKVPAKGTEDVMLRLHESGRLAVRTHFDCTAIKTDAGYEELKKLLL